MNKTIGKYYLLLTVKHLYYFRSGASTPRTDPLPSSAVSRSRTRTQSFGISSFDDLCRLFVRIRKREEEGFLAQEMAASFGKWELEGEQKGGSVPFPVAFLSRMFLACFQLRWAFLRL